ncbi:MAG: hypothetical protein R3B09_10715 [Nannocystaceae bacterium]
MDDLLATIEAHLRAAEGAGYNQRLDALYSAGSAASRLSRAIARGEAPPDRQALRRIFEIPIIGGCVPQCCNASSVRWQAILARIDALRAWGRVDPDALAELPRGLIEPLFAADSRRISMAAAEAFARSPTAVLAHLEVVRVALDHPRWQVVAGLARGLALVASPRPKNIVQMLDGAALHPHPQVRRIAERALQTRRSRADQGARSPSPSPTDPGEPGDDPERTTPRS